MIRKVVAAALALGFLTLSSGANALPDEPVTSVPLVYDANNNLVGTYYSGVTYLKIEKKIYSIGIGLDDFSKPTTTVYYQDENCEGQAFLATYRLALAPTIIVTNKRLYIPESEPRLVDLKSYRTLNLKTSLCSVVNNTGRLALPLNKKFKKYLGVTFPVRLEVPAEAAR